MSWHITRSRGCTAALLATTALVVAAPHSFAATVKADFNGDGYDDLAIGVRYENIGGHQGAGALHVLYGGASGLGTTDNQVFTEDTPGIAGPGSGTGDAFGSTV